MKFALHEFALTAVCVGSFASIPTLCLAGGGGENMLLVVNPNDESSLRIANAYAQPRAIPDSNIDFLTPQTAMGFTALGTTPSTFATTAYAPHNTGGPVASEQWYMSGEIGYAGVRGLTTQQVIDNLTRTASADGAKPAGKIYFEKSSDIRSTTRERYWGGVQDYMTNHGIAWVQETNSPGATPYKKSDVRGAVIGTAAAPLPNGSTYLPGSYVDSLTSSGMGYGGPAQTKVGDYLLTGAGATAGAIAEP